MQNATEISRHVNHIKQCPNLYIASSVSPLNLPDSYKAHHANYIPTKPDGSPHFGFETGDG